MFNQSINSPLTTIYDFRLQQHRQESQSPDYHRYASIGKLPRAPSNGNGIAGSNGAQTHTHTVTVDIHQPKSNGNGNNNNLHLLHATPSFATPPTRRRFFNHKNLRSALTGHRRTASNGGCPLDTSSILSGGKFSSLTSGVGLFQCRYPESLGTLSFQFILHLISL